ncbi:Ku80 protein [Lotmaria passim]
MSKAAVVLVLDITLTDDADFDAACAICGDMITDKMIYASSDEMAVVLAGTCTSRSSLHENSFHKRYRSITVDREMSRPSQQTLESITVARHARQKAAVTSAAAATSSPFDFVEALTVAADVLQTKTSGRKYTRAIYVITEARHAVEHKNDLESLYDLLKRESVTLVVIGVKFGPAKAETVPWAALDVKAQNEIILGDFCDALGASSGVISLSDALGRLSRLRCRRVRQQPMLKLVLRVGGIELATQLFKLSQQELLPTLQRSTRDGVDVVARTDQREVFAVADGQAERRVRVVPSDDLIESFLFGIDAVPCSEADCTAMKVRGPRALEAIAFVQEAEVAPYLQMGGTSALLPLAGDHDGQRGYNALVEAMESMQTAMLVRLVRTRDAAPVLCACFVHQCDAVTSEEDGDVGDDGGCPSQCLIMAPLPFAEDVRAYQFSEYPEICFSAAEEELMDNLIEGLSVDASILAPQNTFNPHLQQYYATLKAKLMRDSVASADGTIEDATASPSTAAAPWVPPLLPQLKGTSTSFFAPGSVVYERMLAQRANLEACAAVFPFEEGSDETSRFSSGRYDGVAGASRASTGADARIGGSVGAWRQVQHHPLTAQEKSPTSPLQQQQQQQRRRLSSVGDTSTSASQRSLSTTAAPVLRTTLGRDEGVEEELASLSTAGTAPHKLDGCGSEVAPASVLNSATESLWHVKTAVRQQSHASAGEALITEHAPD